MRFLVSSSPPAAALRDRAVFVIVPMANPDGVIMGNFKTGLSGDDLNRQFADPQTSLHPTVVAIRNLIENLQKDFKITAFLDLHAHSKKKFIFLYGPHYPLHSVKYYRIRLLPKLICAKGQQFRFAACRFKTETRSLASARIVLWRELGIMNAFTVEASCFGYLSEERETISFSHEAIEDSGKRMGEAILEWLLVKEQRVKKRLAQRGFRRQKFDKIQLAAVAPLPTMSELIQQIKEEEKALQPLPDSASDSQSSEDELPDEQRRIQGEIIAAVEMMEEEPKVPLVALKPEPKRKEVKAEDGEVLFAARRVTKSQTPPPLRRKQGSERTLQQRLYAPVIPVRIPIAESPPRAASVVHKAIVARQQAFLGPKRGSPEPRPIFMRCPQNGFRDTTPEAQYVKLPAALQRVEGLWTRNGPNPRDLGRQIVGKALRHENGAVTDRAMERDVRPQSSLRSHLGATLDRC